LHPAQTAGAHAFDAVKLNACGARATIVFPAALEQTAINNAPVYCPCNDQISATVDDLPDLIPGARLTPSNAAGNHVVITCQGVDIMLSGIKNSSLSVAVGDEVQSGRPLSVVGTSYENTEPHLHIHARSGITPVPMLFDGRFLARATRYSDNIRIRTQKSHEPLPIGSDSF
jgi:hypothetical protein